MASMMTDLEELITCSICMEVLSNPHTLCCLHTFCHPCITKISNQHPDKRITCPTCRAEAELGDVKKDFKMSQLIEVYEYRNSQRKKMKYDDTENLPDDICQLCEVNLVTDVCHKCSKLLCFSCVKGHKKYTNCLADDVEAIDVRSNYCLQKLQELQKSVLENTSDLYRQLDEKCEHHRVEQKQAKHIVRDYTASLEMNACEKIDNIVNEHIKNVEVEFTVQGNRFTDLKELLAETLSKTKAGVVKAFEDVSNKVKTELKEPYHLGCPALKISVNKECLNDLQPLVSVSGRDQVSLDTLLDKTLSVTCTIHLESDVRRVKIIRGDIWCLLLDRIVIRNSHGEPIQTITFPNVATVLVSETGDIIFLSYTHGIYKVDDSYEGHSCLSKDQRYHDIWVGGGHRYAVHVNNDKLCLDELNEEYQLVQHRKTCVDANDRIMLYLTILGGTAFVSSFQFKSIFQIDLGSGRVLKEFCYKVACPMYSDGHHLVISQGTDLSLFKPEDGTVTPLNLSLTTSKSKCRCVFAAGKKLYVNYYDTQVKCWMLAVMGH